jgi:hypothetical protein
VLPTSFLGAVCHLCLDHTPAQREHTYLERWQNAGSALWPLTTTSPSSDLKRHGRRFRARASADHQKTQRSPKLLCKDYAVGAKRSIDTNYFATFSRPNVTLVHLRSALIEAITPIGVRQAGLVHAVDTMHLCDRL